MNEKLKNFVLALGKLEPADDDVSLEQTLDGLVQTINDIEDISPAFRHIFEFFERFPNAEHGSPGPLVHLVERWPSAYVRELVSSIERQPTPNTIWMLNRILNATIPAAQRARFMALLDASIRHPRADARARDQAAHFLQYQQQRSR